MTSTNPLARIHRCGAALGLEQGVRAVGRDGQPLLYNARLNLSVKVLDFVKSGGPKWTVGGTVFEMWLGAPSRPASCAPCHCPDALLRWIRA